jgi:hypothetical protein
MMPAAGRIQSREREDPAMESILTYVEGHLGAVEVDDGYELRYEDRVLGWLGDPKFERTVRCVTRGSEWTFTRMRSGDTEATSGTAPVARYKSNVLPGGTIELPDESRFRLRAPVTGELWKLRRGRREVLLALRPMRNGWEIRFEPAAREIPQLPLVTMVALHAVLVEVGRTTGDTGPSVPLGP